MFGLGWDWVFVATAWVLAALAAVLLAWAMFWDRARGRKRCPKCWYDMGGADSLTCPECGKRAKSERGLRKTRRRWKVAGLAVPLVVAACLSPRVPAIRERGWWAAAPTSLLVLVTPKDDLMTWFNTRGQTGQTPRVQEISARQGRLTPFHLELIAQRIPPMGATEVVRHYDVQDAFDGIHASSRPAGMRFLDEAQFSVCVGRLYERYGSHYAYLFGGPLRVVFVSGERYKLACLGVVLELLGEDPADYVTAYLPESGELAALVPSGRPQSGALANRSTLLFESYAGRDLLIGPPDQVEAFIGSIRGP